MKDKVQLRMKYGSRMLIGVSIALLAMRPEGRGAMAEGINTLKTEAEKQQDAAGSGEQKVSPESAQGEAKDAIKDESKDGEGAEDAVDSEKAGSTAAAKVAPKIEGPSSAGFSAGLGLSSLKVANLETHGLASVQLGGEMVAIRFSDNAAMWGSFRYAAHEFDAIQDGASYRGIAEIYAFGAHYRRHLESSLILVGGGDLGVAKVGIHDLTRFERQEGLTKPGAVITVQGGMEWANSQRTSLGTKLFASFGKVQAVGLLLNSSFMY